MRPRRQLLTPREAAALLGVRVSTVTRWANSGKLRCVFTPGGHRRYLESDIVAIGEGRYFQIIEEESN